MSRLTENTHIVLPEALGNGPNVPVNLGATRARFVLTDKTGNRLKEMDGVTVTGIQRLDREGRLNLQIDDLSISDILDSAINGTALVQFQGQEPIECYCKGAVLEHATWVPLREPVCVRYAPGNGSRIEAVLLTFRTSSGSTTKKSRT